MLQSKGFRKFVLIVGALILAIGAYGAIRIGDESTILLLAVFAVLYVLYAVACVRKAKTEREKDEKNSGRGSPLRPR